MREHRESYVEDTVIKYAVERGWLRRKLRWIGRRGAPDQIFMRDGLIIFVEFKAPGEGPTRQQEREHRRLRKKGARVEVIDSVEQGYEIFT